MILLKYLMWYCHLIECGRWNLSSEHEGKELPFFKNVVGFQTKYQWVDVHSAVWFMTPWKLVPFWKCFQVQKLILKYNEYFLWCISWEATGVFTPSWLYLLPLHLWRKETMGKHEKVSKCFVQDFGTLSDTPWWSLYAKINKD